ncbi:RNA-directed DNA polymerase, eukaryota, reverse transcriptase zinc-binding domain protein [Tanacetum coccineum]
MCERGYGRASFARVLVDVDVAEGIVDSVEIWYKKLNRTMKLRVEYAWQPPICSHCCVFGHGFKGCTSSPLNEEEKAKRNAAKQYARGSGYGRGGVYMGRGSFGSRGRGSFYSRGNFSGVQMNKGRKYVHVKSSDKDKTSDVHGINKQEVDKEKNKNQDAQVKHIAQKNISLNSKFSALAEEDDESDIMNGWQGIKVNIDVACDIGIPINEEDSMKWPHDLQDYYKEKCNSMKEVEKKKVLQNKIGILQHDINLSTSNLEYNANKKAEEGVTFEMENTGNSRNQAYTEIYDRECKRKRLRIQDLFLKKKLDEMEFFILSKQPLDDAVKGGWTDEMIDFYKVRVDDCGLNENEYLKRMKRNEDMEDEVGGDPSAHAVFMTQNIVSSTVDTSMADMVNKDDADEIKLLISENRLSMLAVIKTRLIKKVVNPACDNVFGHWAYLTNSVDSNKGCRITVGWDQGIIDVELIASSDQVMYFEVKLIQDKRSFFISFIYGENKHRDRIKLWKNLNEHMDLVNNRPWSMLGNFNVIMNAYEHSKGVADIYRSCYANFLLYVTSDHCPALLVMSDVIVKNRRVFRFMNYLADKKEFYKTVKDQWCVPIKGYAMFVLARRLKGMKRHLRDLNKKNGNVHDKVIILTEELKKIQIDLDKDPNEEKVLKQKSKVDWLKEGDHNTTFFHNMLKGRKNKSIIVCVKDDLGNEFHDDDVAWKFVSHFQTFLGSCDEIFPIEMLEDLFVKKVDAESALHMVKEVSRDEIKIALFDIKDDKAPGPDGFTSKFFKASWDIMGDDLCAVVQEFFKSGKMLGELNTTLISLVPKCILPSKVTDYRPIACCNMVYKCVSKVITNRIKLVLNGLIDPNQSAFIKGRLIFDNILMVVARFTFKVDIQKAYDTVSWDFLEFCLISFGFHKTMMSWIMVCLKFASFFVCVNGESHGFFKAKRGLRQGDPISPYPFAETRNRNFPNFFGKLVLMEN